MKCPNCGKEIADDSKFCEFCGTKLNLTTSVEKKEPNWFGIIGGSILLIVGLIVMFHSWGSSSQSDNITQTGTIYYGTYIGDQYIYEGMYEAIQKYFSNDDITYVYYSGEYLLQVVPNLGPRGELYVCLKLPHAKTNKFKQLKSFSYFEDDLGCNERYRANCHNDVSLAAKIASDVVQNLFDVPHGATLYYSDN